MTHQQSPTPRARPTFPFPFPTGIADDPPAITYATSPPHVPDVEALVAVIPELPRPSEGLAIVMSLVAAGHATVEQLRRADPANKRDVWSTIKASLSAGDDEAEDWFNRYHELLAQLPSWRSPC